MKEAEEEKRFEEVMRKESAKEIEDIFGAGKDGNSRCSKKGGRNTEEGASFSNGSRTGRIVGNRGEHLEGIPMSSRIAQNLTTPREHGRRDGETKQVDFPILLLKFFLYIFVLTEGDPQVDPDPLPSSPSSSSPPQSSSSW